MEGRDHSKLADVDCCNSFAPRKIGLQVISNIFLMHTSDHDINSYSTSVKEKEGKKAEEDGRKGQKVNTG